MKRITNGLNEIPRFNFGFHELLDRKEKWNIPQKVLHLAFEIVANERNDKYLNWNAAYRLN